jgi:hypothetical protein
MGGETSCWDTAASSWLTFPWSSTSVGVFSSIIALEEEPEPPSPDTAGLVDFFGGIMVCFPKGCSPVLKKTFDLCLNRPLYLSIT